VVEFKDNKEGKINELKVLDFSASLRTSCLPVVQADISKQKTALQKHAVIVKTQQKELQTAALELGVFDICGCQRRNVFLFLCQSN